VQEEVAPGLMGILVEMVDALGIERRGAAFQTVDLISLGQQELRQVRTVLAGNPGD